MPQPLTELERRVLGHLPAWAEDEGAFIEMEGGPRRLDEETGEWVGSIRTYNLPEFTVRLSEDPCAVGLGSDGQGGMVVRHLTAPEVEHQLGLLVERGLAARDDDGDEARWRMTEAGHASLTGPQKMPDQIPGPVEVEPHPAKAKASAKGA